MVVKPTKGQFKWLGTIRKVHFGGGLVLICLFGSDGENHISRAKMCECHRLVF